MLFVLTPASAFPLPDNVDLLRRKAVEQVEQEQWGAAFDLYVRIPRAERTAEDREGCQTCLRHLLQARRLRDKPAQVLLSRLPPAQAVAIYRDVLDTLQTRYVDRDKVAPVRLFLDGVRELRAALNERVFVDDHLADVRPEALRSFKARLDALHDGRVVAGSLKDARDQFQAVLQAAQALRLKPGVVLLEFVCGACHGLDEYTLYLGPRQLGEAEAERDGRAITVGLEVAALDQRLVVTRVYRNSPAEEAGLRPGDVIWSIDGQPVDTSMPGAAAVRLLGEEGTLVDVEVPRMTPDGMLLMPARALRLERRLIAVPSVDPGEELRDGLREHTGVGLIRIASFQRTTAHELKEAIFDLRARLGDAGLRALVLDLRGNPGGSFAAGLQVAELFLQEGVITYTQGRSGKEAHRANNPGAFTMPLVLLIDGETASAAEVVAGAMKERGRALLVGQATFGKSTLQDVFPLDRLKAGLQITIARFCPAARAAFDGRGVTPDRPVERSPMSAADAQRDAALQVAEQVLKMVSR